MILTNRQIVDKVNESFEQGDTEAFLSWCAEDVVWNMVGDRSFSGKQSIRDFMKSTPIEPPQFTVKKVLAKGDYAMAHGDMTMKNKEGLPEDYGYCDIYRFKEQRVAELTSYIVKVKKMIIPENTFGSSR